MRGDITVHLKDVYVVRLADEKWAGQSFFTEDGGPFVYQ